MRVIPVTAAVLAALLLGASAAGAQGLQDFGEWDVDSDGTLDENEFGSIAYDRGIYEQWDADRSGALDRDEFYGGVYGAWDADDDLGVDEEEFGTTGIGWFSEEYDDFDAWDSNYDGEIDDEEFGAVAGESGVYEEWGGGETGLAEDDFYGGLYGAADYNDDARIGFDEDGWFDWF